MRELDFIASVLLILIHMSMGQSTTSLSKKYSQIGVTINSWNSVQFQATDVLGMGSMRWRYSKLSGGDMKYMCVRSKIAYFHHSFQLKGNILWFYMFSS